jgi:mono/diheme cytochrome c family protein
MQRSSLRPIRTRRMAHLAPPPPAARSLSTMKSKTRKTLAAVGAVWLAFAATAASAAPAEAAPPLPAAKQSDPLLARGRYLVEHVGLCADCHTPRNQQGALLPELWLQGAPIGFKPVHPMPFAVAAPPLAGLPTMNEAQAIAFLQTGKRPDGSVPLPPMPEYRFNAEDARAVVAYLKSLGR